jgi:hypothetical protein
MPLARMYEYEDFFLRSGSLKDIIDMTRLVDSSYIQYAVQQLGGPIDNPNLPKPPGDLPVPK